MIKTIKDKTYFLREDNWYSPDKNGLERKVTTKSLLDKLNEKEISGLGDLIKRFTDALGLSQCDGCKTRQAYLNKKFKFYRVNVDAITEARLELFKRVKQTNTVPNEDVNSLFSFYNELFGARLERCNCPGLFISMMDQIESVLLNNIK